MRKTSSNKSQQGKSEGRNNADSGKRPYASKSSSNYNRKSSESRSDEGAYKSSSKPAFKRSDDNRREEGQKSYRKSASPSRGERSNEGGESFGRAKKPYVSAKPGVERDNRPNRKEEKEGGSRPYAERKGEKATGRVSYRDFGRKFEKREDKGRREGNDRFAGERKSERTPGRTDAARDTERKFGRRTDAESTGRGGSDKHSSKSRSNTGSRGRREESAETPRRASKYLEKMKLVNKENNERPAYDSKKLLKTASKEVESKGTRLNKHIANAGVCSRREADELIAQGLVQVNGQVVTEMGHRLSPGDVVTYNGKKLRSEKPVYLLLNKPKDFITTTDDPGERKTVMHLVADACPERIYPVGRLDRNTTGLLLFTNDGELAEKLTHPTHRVKKIYQVDLDKPITKEHFEAIQNGLTLEDGPVHVDEIAIISPDKSILGLEIHVGRNRIVRRIFEHLGYEVLRLDRVMYASLTKKDLSRGHWRFLTEKEVIQLKHLK